jgi:hypothetical protein
VIALANSSYALPKKDDSKSGPIMGAGYMDTDYSIKLISH